MQTLVPPVRRTLSYTNPVFASLRSRPAQGLAEGLRCRVNVMVAQVGAARLLAADIDELAVAPRRRAGASEYYWEMPPLRV
jgi:hypothetical protein